MIGNSPEQFIGRKITQIRDIYPAVNTVIGTDQTTGLALGIGIKLDFNVLSLKRSRGGIYVFTHVHSSHSWDPTRAAVVTGGTEELLHSPFWISFFDNRCGQIAELEIVRIV